MRRGMLLALIVGTSPIAFPGAEAQQTVVAAQPAQPGVTVISFNKCAFSAPASLDSLNALAFFPILDELVNERRLLGWGVLGHLWGDEWNYVIYYTAENLTAFHSAFSEAVRRVNERRPDMWAVFGNLCTEHKDNIYAVRRVGAMPPRP